MEIGKRTLDERERELLAAITVGSDNIARFPKEPQIPDWPALKKVMVALGGTWKTSDGFRFPEHVDADEVVRTARETGEIFDPKTADLFETPDALADRAAARLDLKPGMRVLEPSAGRGRLLRALLRAQPALNVQCVEAVEDNIAGRLASVAHGPTAMSWGPGAVNILHGDFMLTKPGDPGFAPFDRVLMNPPFSRHQDAQHVLHALKFLKPGGTLVAIMGAGLEYREDHLTTEIRRLATAAGSIEPLPHGTFKESGTMVRTVLISIEVP